MLVIRTIVQVISVGSLEGPTMGTDGQMHEAVGQPFSETTHCWEYLRYLTVHFYHVTDEADITFSETRKPKPRAKPAHKVGHKESGLWDDWEAINIRNAHVHVREEQLLQMIEQAMRNIALAAAAKHGARF